MAQDNEEANHNRLRPPAVHITYDIRNSDGSLERAELPFVVGVLADLCGEPEEPLPPLARRRFVQIERESLDAVLAHCAPRLSFQAGRRLERNGAPLKVELRFQSMADFGPERVARQVPGLPEALAAGYPGASHQLDEILRTPAFQRLEASWRGLRYLLREIETSASLKVGVLHATKRELLSNFREAAAPNRGAVWQKVCAEPYGQFRGEPFAVLIGDYEFSNDADDLELLEGMARIGAAAHAPFIAAASPRMFGWASFTLMSEAADLTKIWAGEPYTRWRSFREGPESAYAALVLPRMLLRVPYSDDDEHGEPLWGNAAYALGARLAEAFRVHHWCAEIQGVERGGLVKGLPTLIKGPIEIPIQERLERQLTDSGFTCLVHWKGTDRAVFFTATTCRRPGRLTTRLPYVLAVSRFAQYIKAMLRDRLEAPRSSQECARVLNDWISQYVTADDSLDTERQAKLPLREARIEVEEVPGSPGQFRAIAFLRPHFQLEDTGVAVPVIVELPTAVPRDVAGG